MCRCLQEHERRCHRGFFSHSPIFTLYVVDALRTATPRISSAWRGHPDSLVITLYSSTFLWGCDTGAVLGALPSPTSFAELLKRLNSPENLLPLGSAESQVEQHRNHTKSCSLTSEGGHPAPVLLESKCVFGLSLKLIKAVLEEAQTSCPVNKGCLGRAGFPLQP